MLFDDEPAEKAAKTVGAILGAIPHERGTPYGAAEQVFRDYATGPKGPKEFQEYLTMNAALVAGWTEHYAPIPFPPLPPFLKNYADQRLTDRTGRDESFTKSLGNWIQSFTAILETNKSNADHLHWCMTQIMRTNDKALLERLGAALDRFRERDIPKALFNTALKALEKDVSEKPRKSGREQS